MDHTPEAGTDPAEPIGRLLTDRQVHEQTGIPLGTLRWWRTVGRGPQWRRLGSRLIRYPERDLTAWIEHGEAGR